MESPAAPIRADQYSSGGSDGRRYRPRVCYRVSRVDRPWLAIERRRGSSVSDVSDVSNALVSLCAGILYPTPPPAGTTPPSVAGTPVRVFYGWPLPQQIDLDLAAGICSVSVYPAKMERNTTRYLSRYKKASINSPTLTLTAAGQTVTVSGTIPPASNPHNLGVFVNGVPYVYAVKPNDTLASVAAALATLITGSSSAGPLVTLPAGALLGPVRAGITRKSGSQIRNAQRVFQSTIWADTPAHRDAIAAVIDPVLAATPFVFMPDGTAGNVVYRGSPQTDKDEKSGLYRRDL